MEIFYKINPTNSIRKPNDYRKVSFMSGGLIAI